MKEVIKSLIIDYTIKVFLLLLALLFVFVVLYILFSIHWILGVAGLVFWLYMELK